MSMHHDPELDDVLQDVELIRLAAMLRSTQRAEPPLDEAFRSDLRRQLMQKAWEMGEGRTPWWRRLSAPRAPSLAWAGAAAGVFLIASVVIYMSNQQPGTLDFGSPIAGAHSVQLQQAILVKFNQPMDHKSTEAAVRITPATNVAFSWHDNTLAVQPTNGDLAPNTQYRVTIGSGAKTQSGQKLATAKTITFVTQPSATPPPPSPSPTARATPNSLLTGERRLAALPAGTTYTPQWSADSTTIYFVGGNGALESVTVSDATVKVIVPGGVTYPAISPAGDRLAYVRRGKIQILTLASGSTSEVASSPNVSTLSWAKDQLLWGTTDGVFKADANGESQVAAIPQNTAVVSIAPDGAHAVYQEGASLFALDLASTKSVGFGGAAPLFLGWSPDGSRMLYTTPDGTVVANVRGKPITTIPLAGDTSWSSQAEILIGSDTDLYAVRPDGFGLSKLSSGTYRMPVWAPDGAAFAYARGGGIWAATATPLPSEPSRLDQAAGQVSAFMKARVTQQAAVAGTFLDANGKQAYSSSGLPLLITGDATFSRFYVVSQEITTRNPDAARFVVRLVLTKGALDVSEFEETLTLRRAQASQPFLIDQATAGPTRDLGTGAEVVSVDISAGSIKIVFDSDLISDTAADGVVVLDGNGNRVGGSSTYANRTVVITGLALTPGEPYKLVVKTTVQDVGGRNVPSEYDLSFVGPAAGSSAGNQGDIGSPTPPAEPSTTPTP
jgi:hypothetical protein